MRGFTLIELTVSVAVMVLFAGIVIVGISANAEDAELVQAASDTVAIGEALQSFERETSVRPRGTGGPPAHVLLGPGIAPSLGELGSGPSALLEDALMRPRMAQLGWRGPYLEKLAADPWGHAYVVNCDGYANPAERVWVLSAGKDGVVQTAPGAVKTAGDDIGVIVR